MMGLDQFRAVDPSTSLASLFTDKDVMRLDIRVWRHTAIWFLGCDFILSVNCNLMFLSPLPNFGSNNRQIYRVKGLGIMWGLG